MLSKHRKLSGTPLRPGFYENSLSPGGAVSDEYDASMNGGAPQETPGPLQRVHNNEDSTPWSTAEQQAFILANYLWYMDYNKIALLVGSKSVGRPWAHLVVLLCRDFASQAGVYMDLVRLCQAEECEEYFESSWRHSPEHARCQEAAAAGFKRELLLGPGRQLMQRWLPEVAAGRERYSAVRPAVVLGPVFSAAVLLLHVDLRYHVQEGAV